MIVGTNLNIYANLYKGLGDFTKRSQNHGMIRTVLTPLDAAIHFSSNTVTDWVLLPAVKTAYKTLGFTASMTAGLFSTRLANWVKEGWEDPISTKYLIRMGEWIEGATKGTATSKPIDLPILGSLDRCRISLMRHIYVVSKDFTSILKIPGSLRDYTNWTTIKSESSSENTQEDGEKTLVGALASKAWSLVGQGTQRVKDALLGLIAKVIQISDLPLRWVPLVNQGLEAIALKVDQMRNHIHSSITKKAHKILDDKETEMRKQAIGTVAEISARTLVNQVLSIGIKLAIGHHIYGYARQGLIQVIGDQEVSDSLLSAGALAAKVVGLALISHAALPVIERIHDDYKEDFNTEARTLIELRNLIQLRNLPKIIQWFQAS